MEYISSLAIIEIVQIALGKYANTSNFWRKLRAIARVARVARNYGLFHSFLCHRQKTLVL